jgi:hypothetical protein
MDSISKSGGSNDRIIHNIYEINLRKAKLNVIGLKLIYHFRRRKQLNLLAC